MELKLDALLRALKIVSDPNQPSSHLAVPFSDPRLERYPPFTSFVVDMKDLKNGFHIKFADESMSLFSEIRHNSRFA